MINHMLQLIFNEPKASVFVCKDFSTFSFVVVKLQQFSYTSDALPVTKLTVYN